MSAPFFNPDRAALLFANLPLVEEVRNHNLAVMTSRRQGCDWTAPENQYRSAISELEARR